MISTDFFGGILSIDFEKSLTSLAALFILSPASLAHSNPGTLPSDLNISPSQ